MKISNEDLALIRKMEEIGQRGYYVDSAQLTSLYNRVLEKRVNPTNCGACLKARLNELVEAANRFERMIQLNSKPVEPQKQEDLTPVKEEENKAVRTKKNKK